MDGAQLETTTMNKYRAIEVYFPTGWKAQVYLESLDCYVDIDIIPLFKSPVSAIHWAINNWENN